MLNLTYWLAGSTDYCPEGSRLLVHPFSPYQPQLDAYTQDFDQGIFYPCLVLPIAPPVQWQQHTPMLRQQAQQFQAQQRLFTRLLGAFAIGSRKEQLIAQTETELAVRYNEYSLVQYLQQFQQASLAQQPLAPNALSKPNALASPVLTKDDLAREQQIKQASQAIATIVQPNKASHTQELAQALQAITAQLPAVASGQTPGHIQGDQLAQHQQSYVARHPTVIDVTTTTLADTGTDTTSSNHNVNTIAPNVTPAPSYNLQGHRLNALAPATDPGFQAHKAWKQQHTMRFLEIPTGKVGGTATVGCADPRVVLPIVASYQTISLLDPNFSLNPDIYQAQALPAPYLASITSTNTPLASPITMPLALLPSNDNSNIATTSRKGDNDTNIDNDNISNSNGSSDNHTDYDSHNQHAQQQDATTLDPTCQQRLQQASEIFDQVSQLSGNSLEQLVSRLDFEQVFDALTTTQSHSVFRPTPERAYKPQRFGVSKLPGMHEHGVTSSGINAPLTAHNPAEALMSERKLSDQEIQQARQSLAVDPTSTNGIEIINAQDWMQEPDLMVRAEKCLKSCFGLNAFRPLQQEIIASLLQGRDTLAIMATGSGKSLCYQVPGMCLPGCTLVVSPLLALMDDQVKQLKALGIGAAVYSSRTSPNEKLAIFDGIQNQTIKFLYISPEKITNHYCLQELSHLPFSLIAIDEAHCVSQWGHDFRPNYKQLHRIRQHFRYHLPIIATTATARVNTRADIIASLEMQQPNVIIGDFDRKNISIQVLKVKGKQHRDKELERLLAMPGNLPAIVYCYARKTVENVCNTLNKDGFEATKYHAELPHLEREVNQYQFTSGHSDIMVATIAFGMGINKSDIRTVIHYDYPSTLENYYQEIGRAGRDGEPSKAYLLDDYTNREWRENLILQDLHQNPPQVALDQQQPWENYYQQSQSLRQSNAPVTLATAHQARNSRTISNPSTTHSNHGNTDSSFLQQLGSEYQRPAYTIDTSSPEIEQHPESSPELKLKKLQEVFNFCDSSNCRRRVLLSAFSQNLEQDCNNCDICRKTIDKVEISADFQIVIGMLKIFEQKLSFNKLIQLLTTHISVQSELLYALNLSNKTVSDDYLQNLTQRIETKVAETCTAGTMYWANLVSQLIELGHIKYDKKYNYLQLTDYGVEQFLTKQPLLLAKTDKLYKRDIYKTALKTDLYTIRRNLADILDMRYDALISDPMIRDIATKLPTTEAELAKIDGFNAMRIKHTSKFILGAVRLYQKRLKMRNVHLTAKDKVS